jgi:hypothetical protein
MPSLSSCFFNERAAGAPLGSIEAGERSWRVLLSATTFHAYLSFQLNSQSEFLVSLFIRH